MASRGIGRLAAGVSLLLVAGCGGEGSGGQGNAPLVLVQPPVIPSQTPSPAPTPVEIAAPFGLTVSADMATLGILRSPVERWLEPSEASIAWDAARKTYVITLPDYGTGILADDPGDLAKSAMLMIDAQGRQIARVNLFDPYPDQSVGALELTWRAMTGDPNSQSSGTLLFFQRAAIATPPATGTASYRSGDQESQPTSTLAVNFAAGTVTGLVPLTWTDAWGPYPETSHALENGVYDRATGTIRGSFSVAGSTIAGEVRGQIVGPTGGTLALVVRGPVYNPYENRFEAAWRVLASPRL